MTHESNEENPAEDVAAPAAPKRSVHIFLKVIIYFILGTIVIGFLLFGTCLLLVSGNR